MKKTKFIAKVGNNVKTNKKGGQDGPSPRLRSGKAKKKKNRQISGHKVVGSISNNMLRGHTPEEAVTVIMRQNHLKGKFLESHIEEKPNGRMLVFQPDEKLWKDLQRRTVKGGKNLVKLRVGLNFIKFNLKQ